jgi:NTE family protein
MATRSFLCWLAVSSFLVLLAACESMQTRRLEPAGPQGKPAQSPSQPSSSVQPVPAVPELPPAPTRQEPKKVAVILGPGGAKAFAHVGVLKALQQQRIPIDKVIGLEWGALMGSLFAHKGTVQNLEWKLYKMEQSNLPRPTGFFSRRNDETVKVMDEFLTEAFARDEVARSKIPFDCPSRSLYTGVVTWQNRGLYKDSVRRCLPYPPVFKVQGTFLAGASQASEAIEHLAHEGYNLIILVNVLGSAMPVAQDSLLENVNHVILWQEVKRALGEASRLGVETINVDTSAYPVMQFEAKKDLINLGETAGRVAAGTLISKYGF